MNIKKPTLRECFGLLEKGDWATLKHPNQALAAAKEVEDFFGVNRRLETITYQDVVAFVDHLKNTKNNKGATINAKLARLSKAFKMGRRLQPNLIRPEMPQQKNGKPRSRVLTDEEIDKLLSWDQWEPEYRALLYFLAATGCRLGEALKVKDTVVVADREGAECTFMDTKNGTDRTILLTPEAHRAWLTFSPIVKKATQCNFRRRLVKACAAAGIPYGTKDVCIHTFRHSALTSLAERTDNVLLIQKWAGHKNIQTTQRYVKATKKGMSRLRDNLYK